MRADNVSRENARRTGSSVSNARMRPTVKTVLRRINSTRIPATNTARTSANVCPTVSLRTMNRVSTARKSAATSKSAVCWSWVSADVRGLVPRTRTAGRSPWKIRPFATSVPSRKPKTTGARRPKPCRVTVRAAVRRMRTASRVFWPTEPSATIAILKKITVKITDLPNNVRRGKCAIRPQLCRARSAANAGRRSSKIRVSRPKRCREIVRGAVRRMRTASPVFWRTEPVVTIVWKRKRAKRPRRCPATVPAAVHPRKPAIRVSCRTGPAVTIASISIRAK